MPRIHFDRERSLFTVGRRFWVSIRKRADDSYDYDDNGQRYYLTYRVVVFHWGRLHIFLEWLT